MCFNRSGRPKDAIGRHCLKMSAGKSRGRPASPPLPALSHQGRGKNNPARKLMCSTRSRGRDQWRRTSKSDGSESALAAVGPRVHRRLVEQEILGVEVGDIGVIKPDRAAAVPGEVDYGGAAVGGDAQILESGNARNRSEIDGVFPVGEIVDGIGAKAAIDEGIGVRAAVEIVSSPSPPLTASWPAPPYRSSSPVLPMSLSLPPSP